MSYIDETMIAMDKELDSGVYTDVNTGIIPPAPASNNKTQEAVANIQIPPDITAKILDRILFQSGGVALGIIISAVGLVYILKHIGLGDFISKYMQKIDDSSEVTKSLVNVLNNISEDLKDNHKEYVVQHSEINRNVDSVKETINSELKPSIKNIERDVTKLIDKM